ncbi:MAG: asparaginase [Chloroflexota bacterium]
MKITIVTTGGTISKTFNEADGSLRNDRPVIETILAGLRLPDLAVSYRYVLSKDSLELTDEDRRLIVETVRQVLPESDAVVIAHGTDTLSVTGEMLHQEFPNVPVPVILTGAMRPHEFRDSDAQQNVTEALLACRLAPPGVYVAMHNRLLRFPGVGKDRTSRTFVKNPSRVREEATRAGSASDR